jgi:hypothetical protein
MKRFGILLICLLALNCGGGNSNSVNDTINALSGILEETLAIGGDDYPEVRIALHQQGVYPSWIL